MTSIRVDQSLVSPEASQEFLSVGFKIMINFRLNQTNKYKYYDYITCKVLSMNNYRIHTNYEENNIIRIITHIKAFLF